jgi:serine/threonine protein kinase
MSDICERRKIVKRLGYGVFGSVYLVKDPKTKKEYALKIQKMVCLKKNKNKFVITEEVLREIEFTKKMDKYPQQFMKLHCYTIDNRCFYDQPKPPFKPDKKLQKYLDDLNKSQCCVELMYDLKDGVFGDLEYSYTVKSSSSQIYSYVAQMTYILYLLQKEHYSHTDIHPGNVAYLKTKKKQMKLGKDITVNLHGFIFSLIDFGRVKKTGKTEKQNFRDFFKFCDTLLCGYDWGIWNLIKSGKMVDDKEIDKKIRNSEEYKALKKEYNLPRFNYETKMLFIGIYPEIALRFAGMKRIIQKYKKRLITVEEYIFLWKNRNNLKKLTQYFSKKT